MVLRHIDVSVVDPWVSLAAYLEAMSTRARCVPFDIRKVFFRMKQNCWVNLFNWITLKVEMGKKILKCASSVQIIKKKLDWSTSSVTVINNKNFDNSYLVNKNLCLSRFAKIKSLQRHEFSKQFYHLKAGWDIIYLSMEWAGFRFYIFSLFVAPYFILFFPAFSHLNCK